MVILQDDQNDYRQINNIFRSLNIVNTQICLNFMNYGVADKLLPYLLNSDNELEELIPDMSARILFKGYLLTTSTEISSNANVTSKSSKSRIFILKLTIDVIL